MIFARVLERVGRSIYYYYSKSNAYAEQAWRTHPDKINVYFVSSVPRRYSSEDFAYSIILSDLLRSFGHSSTTRYH